MKIESDKYKNMYLQEIEYRDIDKIRVWKNTHKQSFFFKETITPSMQEKWYEKYKTSEEKIFLIIERFKATEKAIGCVGYRIISNTKIDLFNIMRGEKSLSGVTIKSALELLTSYLCNEYPSCDLTAKVLKSNPAIDWYKKSGFDISEEYEDFYLIKYTGDRDYV